MQLCREYHILCWEISYVFQLPNKKITGTSLRGMASTGTTGNFAVLRNYEEVWAEVGPPDKDWSAIALQQT